MITITDSNREKILKFKQMLTSSYYADSKQVTDVYNEVFGKSEQPTNCGTCIRQRMQSLVGALDAIKADLAKREAEDKAVDAFKVAVEQEKASPAQKKKVGRPRKAK